MVTYSLIMLLMIVISGFVTRALPWAIPLPLVQIGLGTLWASISNDKLDLEPDYFFLLFLPPLLFLDGWQVSKTSLRENRVYILSLALGLVVFTVLGLGFAIHWLIPAMPLAAAMALAAVLSPTDPIAVSAIAARIPIPRRVLHILEGESLLNDASGLVCFKFAVAAVALGTFSLTHAVGTFVWMALGGITIGVGVTLATEWLKARLTEQLGEELGTQILISILIPFGAYLLAEKLACSSILAVVAAGITMSYVENTGRAQALTRLRRRAVWDAIKFSLNGILFVLLGEQLPELLTRAQAAAQEAGHHNWLWLVWDVLVITLVSTLLRLIWGWLVLQINWLVKCTPLNARQVNWRMMGVMAVAGVRGAITLAGILTLPYFLPSLQPYPARDLSILMAGGVIICSLILAAVAIPWLLREQTDEPEVEPAEAEFRLANQVALQAAVTALEQAQHESPPLAYGCELYQQALASVLNDYQQRPDLDALSLTEQNNQRRLVQLEKYLRHLALAAQRDALYQLARQHAISDDTLRQLIRGIDLQEVQLQ